MELNNIIKLGIKTKLAFINACEEFGKCCKKYIDNLKNNGEKFPEGKIYYLDKNNGKYKHKSK